MTFELGPLTAVMVGDSYGCGYEFLPKMPMPSNTGERYLQHTMEPRLPAGCYSDDGQFSLALAELVLCTLENGTPVTALTTIDYGQAMLHGWLRDPRGCSPRMEAAFREAQASGKPLVDVLEAQRGESAGGAMRASVFGLLANPQTVLHCAKVQAEATHAGDGVLAAQAAALMVYLARHGGRSGLREGLTTLLPAQAGLWDTRYGKRATNLGLPCVLAALTALLDATSLRDLLVRCVEVGGDTDTVASIAMGAAWACDDLPNDLPYSLWQGLEDGRYGRGYMREVELRLLRATM